LRQKHDRGPSKTVEHETPEDIFHRYHEAYSFTVDPCTRINHHTAQHILKAGGKIIIPQDELSMDRNNGYIFIDGLKRNWRGADGKPGIVWMNPEIVLWPHEPGVETDPLAEGLLGELRGGLENLSLETFRTPAEVGRGLGARVVLAPVTFPRQGWTWFGGQRPLIEIADWVLHVTHYIKNSLSCFSTSYTASDTFCISLSAPAPPRNLMNQFHALALAVTAM